jgi:hypothetical protein
MQFASSSTLSARGPVPGSRPASPSFIKFQYFVRKTFHARASTSLVEDLASGVWRLATI